MKIKFLAIALTLGMFASSANAIPITWTVEGTFDDGGTLNGSFVYDAEAPFLRIPFDLNFTTTAGSNPAVFGGNFYGPNSIIRRFQNSTDFLGFLLEISPFGSAGSVPLLTLNIQMPTMPVLSDDGGVFSAVPFDWDEFEGGVNRRRLDPQIGGVLSGGSPTAVPEPGTLTLLGVGLLGMGLVRRKAACI